MSRKQNRNHQAAVPAGLAALGSPVASGAFAMIQIESPGPEEDEKREEKIPEEKKPLVAISRNLQEEFSKEEKTPVLEAKKEEKKTVVEKTAEDKKPESTTSQANPATETAPAPAAVIVAVAPASASSTEVPVKSEAIPSESAKLVDHQEENVKSEKITETPAATESKKESPVAVASTDSSVDPEVDALIKEAEEEAAALPVEEGEGETK